MSVNYPLRLPALSFPFSEGGSEKFESLVGNFLSEVWLFISKWPCDVDAGLRRRMLASVF